MADVRKYDTAAMRNASDDIDSKAKTFRSSAEAVDNIVTTFQNWEDEVNKSYVARYKSELKPCLEEVRKLMESYAKYLEGAAEAIEEFVKKNANSL